MDGSPSVSEVYLRRDTAVSAWSISAAPKKASHSHGSVSYVGRHDMPILDFWSTSSALYAPDEGLKDAATVTTSFGPSSTA